MYMAKQSSAVIPGSFKMANCDKASEESSELKVERWSFKTFMVNLAEFGISFLVRSTPRILDEIMILLSYCRLNVNRRYKRKM